MWTLGIDVAKHKHCAHLMDAEGQSLLQKFFFEQSAQGLNALCTKLEELGAPKDELRIGMEATGNYWMILYGHFKQMGFEVLLLNPLITSARRNFNVRGSKTDPDDARSIAMVLREEQVPVSAVADDDLRQLRDLTRLRFDSMQQAVSEKLRLGALLDLAFPEYRKQFSDLFGATSLAVLEEYPTAAQLARINIRRLTNLIQEASRGALGRQKAQHLRDAARSSFAFTGNDATLGLEIRFAVQRINLLLEQIDQLDTQLKFLLDEQQALLQTIPGIGGVWAPTILAEVLPVFHPDDQRGARTFVAIAGLDPKLNDSGQQKGRAKMSKRGSKYLRTAVMQAAEVAVHTTRDPMFAAIYNKHKESGKHHTVALSHVAHKMLHVIFSVLKNKRPYIPNMALNINTSN